MKNPIDNRTKQETDILSQLGEPHPRKCSFAYSVYRIMRLIYCLFFPRNYQRQFRRFGVNFFLPGKNLVERHIIKRGVWEREQVDYFFSAAKQKQCDVFLDVGANFGYYSLIAMRLNMFAEVHAIEPHPKIYSLLLNHIRINNFNAITPHNIAASDSKDDMFITKEAKGSAMVFKDEKENTIVIQSATLDSVFSFSGRNIAVKIDVEGHEVAALAGMKELLANNNILLQIEVWGHKPESVHYLINNGFRLIFRIEDDYYFIKNDNRSATTAAA